MRFAVVLTLAAACSSSGGAGGQAPDAAPGTDGGAENDGAVGADGGSEAVQCPMRTAPVGEADGPVAADEIWEGDLWLNDAVGEQLVGIRVVTGDLRVSGGASPLTFPTVEVVGGDLLLGNNDEPLVAVALPALETVGGEVRSSGKSIESIWLPLLETVGDSIWINQDGGALTDLDIGCLVHIENGLLIANASVTRLELSRLTSAWTIGIGANDELNQLDLPALTTFASLEVGGDALNSVSLPALQNLGGGTPQIEIAGCPALESIEVGEVPEVGVVRLENLPSLSSLSLGGTAAITDILEIDRVGTLSSLDGLAGLTTVGFMEVRENADLVDVGGLDEVTDAGYLRIEYNPELGSISMASLETVGGLDLEGNAVLESIGFGALETVTGTEHHITGNPLLPSCLGEALRDRVTYPVDAQWYISANDDDAVCP